MADPTTSPQLGIINAAPGAAASASGVNPITPAQPAAAPAPPTTPNTSTTTPSPPTAPAPQTASATTYTAAPVAVTPDQTTVGQLQKIISSGSPLMTLAETNARQQMNERGLINSSIGIGAGETALLAAATPIAESTAQTYATAAQQNAAATNTAAQQNAQLQTSTAQFNVAQKTQTDIANLQANTTLTAQDKADQSAQILAEMNNATQQQIAQINADTSGSIEDKQAATQTAVAQMNNENAQVIQKMQNDASMANILANGTINTKIAQLNNANQDLLQSSSGAANLYNTFLSNMSAIATNANLSSDQKATALNDMVAQLDSGLSAMSTILGTPEATAALDFGTGANAANAPASATTSTTPTGYNTSNQNLMSILGGSLRNPGGSTPIQDIARAMSQGATITDAEWAQAGLPSGGGAVGDQLKAAIFGSPQPTLAAANPTVQPSLLNAA